MKENVWEAAIRRLASTTASPNGSYAALTPRQAPRKDWLPAKAREVAMIDPPVWSVLRRAAAGEVRWPLVLLGAPGVGKTCAALCLLDLVGGFYFAAADLAEQLLQAQKGRVSTIEGRETVWPERVWRELGRCALVVIDEANGAGTSAAWLREHHHECLKKALDVRECKPLVCVSNLDLGRIEAVYDARIASRLAGGTVLALDGQDRRLRD